LLSASAHGIARQPRYSSAPLSARPPPDQGIETHVNDVPWLPIDHAQALDGAADWVPQVWRDMDMSLAAAPLGNTDIAVVLGRPGGAQFRPSKVARLGYLDGIVATIVRQQDSVGTLDEFSVDEKHDVSLTVGALVVTAGVLVSVAGGCRIFATYLSARFRDLCLTGRLGACQRSRHRHHTQRDRGDREGGGH
jgi:hypothetical protein